MRRLLRAVLAAVVLSVVPVATSLPAQAQAASVALSGAEATYLNDINALRAQHGLGALTADAQLTQIARNWSAHMAGANTLAHNPNFIGQVTSSWAKLGENVGEGPTVNSIWNAFVASPHHYENLVDPAYNRVGVGVVVDTAGIIWTAHDFEAANGVAPPPPPAPARRVAVAPPPPPAPVAPIAAPATTAPVATAPGATAPATAPAIPPVPGPLPSAPSGPAPGHEVVVQLEELHSLDATNG